MKLSFTFALLTFGLTVAAAQVRQQRVTQNPQQQQQSNAPKATIEGTVSRSGGGQPLKNARVTLSRTTNAAQNGLNPAALQQLGGNANRVGALIANLAGGVVTVVTDSNGHFVLTNVDPGQYRISAEREGFVRAEYGQRTPTGHGIDVPVASGQRLNLNLQMVSASVISGRVVTPEGEPATRNSVEAYTYQYSNGERTLAQVANTQTNDLGEYRLFGLQPGDYFVSVTSNDTTDDTPVGTVDVSQARGGRGNPAGALQAITAALGDRGPIIQALGGSNNPPVYYPGTIDPDGATVIAVAASVEVRGVDFNLRPVQAATISGRVVAPFPLGQGGAPAGRGGRGARGGAGAAVQVPTTGGSPVQINISRVGSGSAGLAGLLSLRLGATPVGPDGTFELKDVAPGQYNVTATARDPNGQEYSARTRVDVGTSDIHNVVVSLRAGLEIPGKITLETTPPQQFKMTSLRVSLVAEDGGLPGVFNFAVGRGGGEVGFDIVSALGGGQRGGQLATESVNEDGSFTLKNVGAMEYRVRVTGLPPGAYIQTGRIGSNDALNAPFNVDSPGTPLQLQIGFAAGRVAGTVIDTRGSAAAGAQAVLVPDEPRRGRNDAYFTATSGQNGQFTFNNVPPGLYKLFAWEDIPAGAYQYPDFIRRYEDRGQLVTVNPNGMVTADARLIPAN